MFLDFHEVKQDNDPVIKESDDYKPPPYWAE